LVAHSTKGQSFFRTKSTTYPNYSHQQTSQKSLFLKILQAGVLKIFKTLNDIILGKTFLKLIQFKLSNKLFTCDSSLIIRKSNFLRYILFVGFTLTNEMTMSCPYFTKLKSCNLNSYNSKNHLNQKNSSVPYEHTSKP